MKNERTFEEEVEYYKRKLKELIARLEKAESIDECFEIDEEEHQLLVSLMNKNARDLLEKLTNAKTSSEKDKIRKSKEFDKIFASVESIYTEEGLAIFDAIKKERNSFESAFHYRLESFGLPGKRF